MHAVVPPDDPPLIPEQSGTARQFFQPPQRLAETLAGHLKAGILTVRLVGGHKAVFGGDTPHLALVHRADRKAHHRQNRLVEPVQEIALVLFQVVPPAQFIDAAVFGELRIVAGQHLRGPG